jgi:O-antigen ligase
MVAAGSVAVVLLVRNRLKPRIPAVVWLALLYVAWMVSVTMFGINPAKGMPKLPKLVWFLFIPVASFFIDSPPRLRQTLIAYVLGMVVLSVQVCVRNPMRAMASVASGEYGTFAEALIGHGSITNGERLMIGVIAGVGLAWIAFRERRLFWAWLVPLTLIGAAFVVNFKRGSWLVGALCAGVFLAAHAGRRVVAAGAGVVLLLLLLPPVQMRMGELRREFDSGGGGRLTMWTKVAPALIRAHPFGIGYRVLTNDMMRRIAPEVEPRRDHVHSNVLQVTIEAGWVGLAIYLAWMATALCNAFRGVACAAVLPGAGDRAGPWVVLLMLSALILNGIVEYNMGDSEIVLLYVWLLGAVVVISGRGFDTPAA